MEATSYRDVNITLRTLLAGVQAVLGGHFVGLYLYGSLASGDFDPERSDIDFVVVTDGGLPEELILALEAMHARLWAGGGKWALKLEGAYVPRGALRRYDPASAPRPCVNEGRFYTVREEPDWIIQRHVLREQGVVVAGPPLAPLIDPVSPEDLRGAVRGYLREWWAPMLEDPARLRSREYQAYAVLSMCRAVYTLEHGAIVSKGAAARWAQKALDPRWAPVIERALAWPRGEQRDEIEGTLELIRLAVQKGQLT